MTKKRNKPGPKPKIDATAAAKIYAILETGGSLADAAHCLGISAPTLRYHKARHPEFKRGVLRAEKTGKLHLIEKVGKSTAWQAAAWMLERKWGSEFGRKDTVKQEHTGKNGGPIESKTTLDLSGLTESELCQWRELRNKARISNN